MKRRSTGPYQGLGFRVWGLVCFSDQKAIEIFLKEAVRIVGSGRLRAGHVGYVFHGPITGRRQS